jgi:transcriptional repressor NrdR
MRCPVCRFDDSKVVDSRAADEGASIRRRRSCLACGERFTTYERIDRAPLVVMKRNGQRQPFDRAKLVEGVTLASKGRPVAADQIESLATEVEDQIRLDGPEVTTTAVGLAVLERLRALDEVAYLRFASVYKNFSGAEDFRRELRLLAKLTDAPA